jgi:hypothetical protein
MRNWKPRFLEVLSQGTTVTTAAAAAGIDRSTANRARKTDAAFNTAWTEAEEQGTDVLEEAAIKRAVEFSDTLLLALLRARRPEKFMERQRLEHVRVDLSSAQEELENMARKILEADDEDEAEETKQLTGPKTS